MRVDQVMTNDVTTCNPNESLERAAQIMWERDCGFVPVVTDGTARRVVGVLTDRGACMASYTRGRSLPGIRIGDVMSTGLRTCKASDDLSPPRTGPRTAQVT